MYIRRKVFSVLQDESGEERYFSTTDYVYDDRMFSKDSEKKKSHNGIYLEDINSHRGLGRSMILGAVLPGAIGGYAGKKAANKADNEGLSDREILKKAKRKGSKVGALAGGLAGAVTSVPFAAAAHHFTGGNKLATAAVPVALSTVGAGVGALGGYLGAKKNTKTRLAKRAQMERNISQKD
jgi:hypothetical protein